MQQSFGGTEPGDAQSCTERAGNLQRPHPQGPNSPRGTLLGIEARSQPNLQRVSGVCTKVLDRAAGKMSESAKYIWCQHCYTGWIAKEDKPYYPKCWSCGMGWRKRTRRPRWWSEEDAWDAQWPQTYPAQEVGCYPPPGLGPDDRS